MAAPSLDVDWDKVRAHAQQHGAREAARAFEISENTVLWRSANEGWFKDAGKQITVQELPASMQPKPIKPISAALAQERTAVSLGEKTRSRFARGIARGALRVANMRPAKVLAEAQSIKQLVDAGAKLHGWGSEGTQNQALVQIALMSAPPVEHEPGATQGAVEH